MPTAASRYYYISQGVKSQMPMQTVPITTSRNRKTATSFRNTVKFNAIRFTQHPNVPLNSPCRTPQCLRDRIGTTSGIGTDMLQNLYSDIYSGTSLIFHPGLKTSQLGFFTLKMPDLTTVSARRTIAEKQQKMAYINLKTAKIFWRYKRTLNRQDPFICYSI